MRHLQASWLFTALPAAAFGLIDSKSSYVITGCLLFSKFLQCWRTVCEAWASLLVISSLFGSSAPLVLLHLLHQVQCAAYSAVYVDLSLS